MPAPLLAVALLSLARVVVVRDGSRTVLAVQSETEWPLPAGVSRADAKPVPAAVFDAIDRDAPVLDEEWEDDPCPAPEPSDDRQNGMGRMNGGREGGPFVARYDRPVGAKRSAAVETAEAGFRVEYTEPALHIPLVVGREVVIHVLAHTRFDAADAPTMILPEKVDVPPAAGGQFHAFFEALFENATARTPGVVVTEAAGPFAEYQAGPSRDTMRRLLGAEGQGELTATRLHVRPLTGTLSLQPVDLHGFLQKEYVVHHPWDAPVRCVDPERGMWQRTTQIPIAPAAPPSASPALPADDRDPLDGLEAPEVGVHRSAWARLAPFDRGAIFGGAFGVVAALATRRRRPPAQRTPASPPSRSS